jgi:hypothetical protein
MTFSHHQDSNTEIESLLLDIGDTIPAQQLARLQDLNPRLHFKLIEGGRSLEISSRKIFLNLPELPPEETARRMELVEKMRKRDAEFWDSLTSAEKEDNDRAFEELHQLLDEARR